jgi:heme-degrading monooxygenase HmoA
MYMRIAWVQVEPGQAANYENAFRNVASAGNMRAIWLTNSHDNSDSYFIVTLWDSLEAIQKWEESSDYKERFSPALRPYILGNYSVSVCEVKYSRGAAS